MSGTTQDRERKVSMENRLRKFLFLVWIVLFAFSSTAALAQQGAAPARKRPINIFNYKAELKLTDSQVGRIEDILKGLNRELRVLRAKRTLLDVEIETLLDEEADIAQIKSTINEAFAVRASIRIAAVEAARKLHSVLSSSQLKRWREIQAAARSGRNKP